MKRTSFTPVRLTPHERAALERAAQHRGGTISDALRAAIRAMYIEPPDTPKHETKEAPKFVESAGASFCVQS